MVATPVITRRLPITPLGIGAQIESAFALWLASARATFPFALLYAVAGLLPALTLGDLSRRLLEVGSNIAISAFVPWLPEPRNETPMALLRDIWAWLTSPSTLVVIAISILLAIFALAAVLHRQHRIAAGDDPGLLGSARIAAKRTPMTTLAGLLYSAIIVITTLPIGALAVGLFLLALQVADFATLFVLLAAFLLGALLLSIPLAWASVAFGFAPVLCVVDGSGPFAALRRSAQLVRGHWVPAATVVTVPTLIYLGIGSTVSSLTLVAAAGIAYLVGGFAALLDGGWLFWAQLLGAAPMALALPLLTAGFVVSLNDLQLRAAA